LAKLRALRGDMKVLIAVDGGVNPANSPDLARAGANVLAAGSPALQGTRTDADNVAALRANVISCANSV
jgi:pentose-5-phosphate-3-epimerase